MLEDLREEVLQANLELVRQGLVVDTFGNASGISRKEGLVVIKPSGVDYESLKAQDLVVTDLEGQMVEGDFRPSSDLATHLMLYRSLAQLGGVVHTHSRYATAWAQAGREIPPLGTTHADYFYGPVPVTEWMEAHEIEQDYELNTGCVIVRRFAELDPESMPAVLVAGHGPFCWGASAREAAHVAVLLEEVARMAYYTVTLNSAATSISRAL
ncbi:L-ribulose-5-phosphate 4-epimerase AraD, partial [Acidobacteria bacterium AH-259-O06]|nr:L-ribulose-5-phosphate 4-epimerase AraD [Acidobacteria bacterium AH-259-O06]